MNTCDYIIETLYINGIDTYFVITGGAIVPFINAIARIPKSSITAFSMNNPRLWLPKDTTDLQVRLRV